MKKKYLLLIVLLFLTAACRNDKSQSLKKIEYTITDVDCTTNRMNELEGKEVYIIKDVNLYENLEDFKIITTLQKGSIAKINKFIKVEKNDIIERNKYLFQKDNKYFQFYLITTDKNQIGWIDTSSFLYPYLISSNIIYGVSERPSVIESTEMMDKKYYFSNLTLIVCKNNKMFELNLEKNIIDKTEKFGSDLGFNPKTIYLKDQNNDGINELILVGDNVDDIHNESAELWFNLIDDNLIKIFKKELSFSVELSSLKFYHSFFSNNNGFIDNIIETEEYYGPIGTSAYFDEKETYISNVKYKWVNNKYVKEVEIFSPINDNIELKEEPKVSGKKVIDLNKSNKISIIFRKKKNDIIDGKEVTWVYVKSDNEKDGWCFYHLLKKQ